MNFGSKFYYSIGQFDSAGDFAGQDAVGRVRGRHLRFSCFSDEKNIFTQDKLLIDSVLLEKRSN